MVKWQQNKWKADTILFQLDDIANALWRKFVTSFNTAITLNVSISQSSSEAASKGITC